MKSAPILLSTIVLLAQLPAQDRTFDQVHCASAGWPNGLALWMPLNGFSWAVPGTFIEREDGTARLTGLAAWDNNPNARFEVDVRMGGHVAPGEPDHPPAGSPFIFEPTHPLWVWNGGPIDPAIWRYYTKVEATLIGRGDFTGAFIEMSRRGAAFQIGLGASGSTPEVGAAGWFNVVVTLPPITWPTTPVPPNTIGEMAVRLGKTYFGTPAHPGSATDLLLASGVNDGATTSGVGEDVKRVEPGDTVTLEIASPLGTHANDAMVIWSHFDSYTAPPLGLHGLLGDVFVSIPTFSVLMESCPIGAALNTGQPPPIEFEIPVSLSGQTCLFQAWIRSTTDPRGFVTSDGHRIMVQ